MVTEVRMKSEGRRKCTGFGLSSSRGETALLAEFIAAEVLGFDIVVLLSNGDQMVETGVVAGVHYYCKLYKIL